MNVYHNELFTDGDVLGGEEAATSSQTMGARPGTAQKMQQQRNTLAARRAERMQANIYQSNETSINRNQGSPAPRPPGYPRNQFAESPSQHHQGYGSGTNGNNVYGLASTFDPNEENGQQVTRQVVPRQNIPQSPSLDLSDIRSFLMQPGPRNGPVMCYIVRDKGSAKMYPKVRMRQYV